MFKTVKLYNFGQYLRNLRESLGLSRKYVEDIAGISCDSLRRIEIGEVVPRYETLVCLSKVLNGDL